MAKPPLMALPFFSSLLCTNYFSLPFPLRVVNILIVKGRIVVFMLSRVECSGKLVIELGF